MLLPLIDFTKLETVEEPKVCVEPSNVIKDGAFTSVEFVEMKLSEVKRDTMVAYKGFSFLKRESRQEISSRFEYSNITVSVGKHVRADSKEYAYFVKDETNPVPEPEPDNSLREQCDANPISMLEI